MIGKEKNAAQMQSTKKVQKLAPYSADVPRFDHPKERKGVSCICDSSIFKPLDRCILCSSNVETARQVLKT